MNLFKKYFNYESPDMLKYLHNLETTDGNNQATSLSDKSFINFGDKVRIMPKNDKENEGIQILDIVNNILNFTSKEQQEGKVLKILTLDQMLSRLPITLA